MERPSAARRRLTVLPLCAATFFIVSGGPYGLEEIVLGHGYARTLVLLAVMPLVWSLPVALMVGELGSALPATGGFYVWVTRAMGPFWGLQEAWLSLAVTIFDIAIYPALLVTYLGQVWPEAGRLGFGEPGWLLAIGLIAAGTLWNALGIRAVGRGVEWLGALVLAPFALMVVLATLSLPRGGLAQIGGALAAPPPATGAAVWVAGLMTCMWNYMGWDNASTFAGEVEAPQRSYPRAMLLTVAAVAVSYLVAVAAGAATGLPAERWTAGSWAEVAARLGGEPLRWLVVACGSVAVSGMFVGILLSWSRLPVALGEDGWLPRAFARRSMRTGAPIPALLAGAVLCALCVGLGLRRLIEIDVLLYGASLVLELVALVVLRLREPDLPRPFRVPGGLAGAIGVALLPTALLALAVLAAWQGRAQAVALGLTSLELVGAVASAGLVWYLAVRPGRRVGAGFPPGVVCGERVEEVASPLTLKEPPV